MTTTEQKRANYDSSEMMERSKSLQQEAIEDETGGVFVIHRVHLDFIEKLDLKTAGEKWTDEEKQKINELTAPLSDRVAEFVSKELENNDKLGLLEIRVGDGNFKEVANLMSAGSMLREMLSLIK